MSNLTIAIAQINPALNDLSHNFKLHKELINSAIDARADLILFPELSLTGYLLKDLVKIVAINPATNDYINKLKELSKNIAIVFGFVEQSDEGFLYNSAAFLESGEIKHIHRKVYLPTYGMFDESRYFASGQRVRSFSALGGKFGILICEDFWHISASYVLAMDGTHFLFVPTSSPYRALGGEDTLDNRLLVEQLNRSIAQILSLYIIMVNRVGCEDGITFWGGSEVIDPFGSVVAKAKYFEPELLFTQISSDEVRRARAIMPILSDENLQLTLSEIKRIQERTTGSTY